MVHKALVAVAIVAIVLSLSAAALLVVDPPIFGIADTDTDRFDFCDTLVMDNRVFGQFPDVEGEGRRYGELFTQRVMWISWFKDGESFPLTVEARLWACNRTTGLPSPPDNIYYRFLYRETKSDSWIGFSQDDVPGGVYHGTIGLGAFDLETPLGAFQLRIDGFTFNECEFDDSNVEARDDIIGGIQKWKENYDIQCDRTGDVRDIRDGATLRVEVLIESKVGGLFGLNEYEPVLMAWDEIELRYATPDVGFSAPAAIIGQTLLVEWDAPTTVYEDCSLLGVCVESPAYFLEVRDMNTNMPIPGFERTPIATKSGNKPILLTTDMFSHDVPTCQNRLRAFIFSQLIIAKTADAAVQKDPTADSEISVGAPPVVTEITFNEVEYEEGDTVFISWTVTGNVSKYHLKIQGVADFERDILDPTKRNESFRAAFAGVGIAEVTAYNLCQPSEVKTAEFSVGNVSPGLCELFPQVEDCTDEDDLSWVIFVILGGLAFLFGIVLLIFSAPQVANPGGKAGILIGFVIIGLGSLGVYVGLLAGGFL